MIIDLDPHTCGKLGSRSRRNPHLTFALSPQVIFLFLGGFAIAAALDKYQLSGRIAAGLLSRAGTRPSRILLALLCMGVLFRPNLNLNLNPNLNPNPNPLHGGSVSVG